jgi:Domain of unkown function (DUF1775)
VSLLIPVGRSSAVLAATAGLVLLGAGPALAHVEVTAQGAAQAGTGPVTLLFSAEAESTTSGIVGVRTQLPEGIEPGAVSLASAPQGWALAPIAGGFELSGPATVPGEDLAYGVTVALLPADATELVFPTVQRYADGREDAWIEPVTDAVPDPGMPAPALAVAPAPPGVTPSATPAPATTDTPAPTTAAETSDAAGSGAPEDGGIGTGTVVLLGVLAVAVAVTAGVVLRRRARL